MGAVKKLLAGTVLAAAVGVGIIAFVSARINRVPPVPSGFVAPTSLAFSAAQLAPADILFDSNRTGNFEIWAMGGDGGKERKLTSDPSTDAWWPRPSPDRSRILFNRVPAGVHDTDTSKVSLWVMDASGANQQLLRPPGLDGWGQQGHAEWSPDGTQLVMFGGSALNPQIYITDPAGQSPRALTDRGGTNIDPSFSPDGQTVTFVGCPRSFCQASDYEIYTVAASGGPVTRITDDNLRDHDPYYSPDGTQLAWLTEVAKPSKSDPTGVWDVRVGAADGTGARRLTNDTNITSRPIWARDGKSVLVHRLEKGKDTAFQLFRIELATGAITRLTSGPSVNEYPG
jgi:Tol biopolymer transport system component